jgi:hypothetical protein
MHAALTSTAGSRILTGEPKPNPIFKALRDAAGAGGVDYEAERSAARTAAQAAAGALLAVAPCDDIVLCAQPRAALVRPVICQSTPDPCPPCPMPPCDMRVTIT